MEKDRVSILNALKRILLNEKDDKDGDKNLEEIIDDQNTSQNDKELAEYLLNKAFHILCILFYILYFELNICNTYMLVHIA